VKPRKQDESEQLLRYEDELLLHGDERFRLMIESFREYAFMTIGLDGRIKSWDGGAQKLLGYSKIEAIGMNASVIFTAADIEHGADQLEMATALRDGFAEDERWHVRKDSTRFWGRGIMVPIRSGTRHIGYGKMFRDRTREMQRERRKDDFVSIAGHELRTPLSILKSNIELLLLAQNREDDSSLRALHLMNEQVDRISQLIADLLDMSKIATGQIMLNLTPVRLDHFLKEWASHYQSISKSHAIHLIKLTEAEVSIDKQKIIQVVNNLVSNAMKYSPESERVDISALNKRDYAEVQVRDYGSGIPMTERAKIFDRFYRIKGTREGGLGIGLYVAAEIVKAHGGTIGVADTKGKGATLYFTIPKKRAL